MLFSRIKVQFFILAGISIAILAPVLLGAKLFSQKTPVALYVYDSCGGCNIQNPCKPCTLFIEQTNKYLRILGENNLRAKTDFRSYNVYMYNDEETYRSHMAAIGLEEAPALPAILVGDMIISGRDELDNLAVAVKASRRVVPLLKQFFKVSGKEKIKMGIYDIKTIVTFSLPYCEDCIRTESFLESLPGINVVKIDPSDATGRLLYERYCKTYGVPVNDYAVPRLFIQRSSFLGYQEASLSLETALKGNFKTIKIELN